jgi:hypothetical protein
MDALLLATGFTGALTLLYLARVFGLFPRATAARVHFGPAGTCLEPALAALAAAKREALVMLPRLCARPLAQALIDAKLRGVVVDVLLSPADEADPRSDLSFLREQGLAPLIDRQPGPLAALVLDGRVVVTGVFPAAEEKGAEGLVVLHGQPGLADAFREEFNTRRAGAQPAPAPAEVEKEAA